jgi:hypothetical protein
VNSHVARVTLQYALMVACIVPVACRAADERLLGALDETAEIGQLARVRSIPASAAVVAGAKVFQAELSDLRSKFGSAPVARLSEREGSPLALCYFAGDVALIFRAGAMGGWKRVTGVTAVRAESLGTLRLDCARSAALTAWVRGPGNDLLDRQQLSKRLGMDSLPANGLMATSRWMVGGKEYSRTTAVTYDQGASLTWFDMSQFVER